MANFRNPYVQPFAIDSIWNTPIGSGATYAAANLSRPIDPTDSTSTLYAPLPQTDEEIIVQSPSSPNVTVSYSSVGWGGGNRCGATGGSLDTIPIPNSFVIPSNGENGSAAFLKADRRSIAQNQPFTRCTAGGGATAYVTFNEVDFYGSGATGAHGGSGLSALGGSIRVGELRPGQQGPKHVLKLNVYARQFLYAGATWADCYRWPAIGADGYAVGHYGANSNATNASNSQMKMGALLAIPPTTNIAALGLVTEPALQLAWTLQNYGAYIVDDTWGPSWCWNIENGTAGSKAVEFNNDYGFAFFQRWIDNASFPWIGDQIKLMGALRVVSNNSPSSIGGGGTPRQALADPLSGSFLNNANAFNNASTTLTVAVPSGTVNGNLMLASIGYNGNATITPPGGWTLIATNSSGATSTDAKLSTYTKVANGEPANYTWTFNVANAVNGYIWALKDIDTNTPVNASSTNSGTGTTVTHSSVTPSVNNTLLCAIATNAAATGSFSTPTFWTSRNGVGTGSNMQTVGRTASYYDTASTGNVTSTSGANAKWATQLLALSPQTTIPTSPLFVTGVSNTAAVGTIGVTRRITL
jgi:hypothetical protein